VNYESIKNLVKLFAAAFVVTGAFILIYPFLGAYFLFGGLLSPPFSYIVMALVTGIGAVILLSYANSRIGATDERAGGFTEVDTSRLHRVIVDSKTGKEKIITGHKDATFRSAAKQNWPFKGIDQGSDWMIVDDRGNEITDKKLSACDDIARIQLKT
jgi:hypothetical protein